MPSHFGGSDRGVPHALSSSLGHLLVSRLYPRKIGHPVEVLIEAVEFGGAVPPDDEGGVVGIDEVHRRAFVEVEGVGQAIAVLDLEVGQANQITEPADDGFAIDAVGIA